MTEDSLPAGTFSAWLDGIQSALRGDRGSDVPCDGCTACCTSSQFVHIGPEEGKALARIPAELLFPAPRLPAGHVLMGYDDDGHCPMLVDGACSIYEDRPRTCRTYDCRVFPATGIDLDDERKGSIAQRARRWRFDFPTDDDQVRHAAVVAAARFVQEHAADLGEVALGPPQHAVLAIRLHGAFLVREGDADRLSVVPDPEPEAIRACLTSGSPPR